MTNKEILEINAGINYSKSNKIEKSNKIDLRKPEEDTHRKYDLLYCNGSAASRQLFVEKTNALSKDGWKPMTDIIPLSNGNIVQQWVLIPISEFLNYE